MVRRYSDARSDALCERHPAAYADDGALWRDRKGKYGCPRPDHSRTPGVYSHVLLPLLHGETIGGRAIARWQLALWSKSSAKTGYLGENAKQLLHISPY